MEEGKVWTVEPLRCCVKGCESIPRLLVEARGEPPSYVCNRHLNRLLHNPDAAAGKLLPWA